MTKRKTKSFHFCRCSYLSLSLYGKNITGMNTTENNTCTTITMLGTGYATATECYNTCFLLKTAEGMLLTDAGGGNGILTQMKKAGEDPARLDHMFITHAHTDHILGAVWIVRTAIQHTLNGLRTNVLCVYGHDRVVRVLRSICEMTLPGKYIPLLDSAVRFIILSDGDTFNVGDMKFTCFDIHSTKEKQFGYRAELPGGISLVCLGDEPFNETNRSMAANADWLMCEAFCLYADREEMKPYSKHHSTVLDAARTASDLNASNLLLFHTEDRSMTTRRQTYTQEAATAFAGNIFVPDDLETIIVVKGK